MTGRRLRGGASTARPTYPSSTDGPITYFPVGWNGAVRGWVWISDDDDAAGYVPRRAAGDEGFRTGVAWVGLLASAYEDGLSPRAALQRYAALPPRMGLGQLLLEQPGYADSVSDLRRGRR
ncbi:hypothetical protein [Desertivibrio insolitus]|uniref:hypothetical protein n=1 Tax=Herbiconiux sp. SYSU D00978 TaxID=2812562 RepID=UPI001A9676FD|nr:hypothetical protein [Herbiconiux sp. SYSU D00978]